MNQTGVLFFGTPGIREQKGCFSVKVASTATLALTKGTFRPTISGGGARRLYVPRISCNIFVFSVSDSRQNK